MKISELSRESGAPLSTIKYYIREGLLAPGATTGRNQADYGVEHVKRLALIRALSEVGGLSLTAIARVLQAADGATAEPVLAAVDALDPGAGGAAADPAVDLSAQQILSVAARVGWRVEERDVSLRSAARALAALKPAFPDECEDDLVPYFEAAMLIARSELPDDWEQQGSAEDALRYALLGTILFEPLILALRRVAHVTRMRQIRDKGGAPASKKKKARRGGPRSA